MASSNQSLINLTSDIRQRTQELDSLKGGPGSGNFGHSGIPGQVGGSGLGGGDKKVAVERVNAGLASEWKAALGGDVPPEDPNFVYHATFANRVESIAENGLVAGQQPNFPGFSNPNYISLAPTVKDVEYWSSGAFWRNYDAAGEKAGAHALAVSVDKPVILRTPLQDTFTSSRRDELNSDRSIPPEKLELWRAEEGKWVSLSTARKSLLSLKAAPQLSAYVFNPYARTYVPVSGRAIDTSGVRKIVDEVRRGSQERLAEAALKLQSGELTNLTQFSLDLKEELRNLWTTTHILARGGLDEMTPKDWGVLGQSLKEQYSYANSMVRDIENGNIGVKDSNGEVIVRDSGIPELSDGFLNRVDLYTESSWGAKGEFENVVRDREMELGSLERRVLGDSSKSCGDCIEAADRDFQPPGLLPDIGDTECGPGCCCFFEFENQELDDLAAAFGHPEIGVEGDEPLPTTDFTLYPDEGKSLALKGGPGSGNFGHEGRPGIVGGSGGGGVEAGSLGTIHGTAPTAIIRYMANPSQGYSKDQIRSVLSHYGVSINPNTLNTQYHHGQSGQMGAILTQGEKDEIHILANKQEEPIQGSGTPPEFQQSSTQQPQDLASAKTQYQQDKVERATTKLNRMLDTGIKRYLKENRKDPEAPKHAETFRQAMGLTYSRMSDNALIRAGRSLTKFNFVSSIDQVNAAHAALTGETQRSGVRVAGYYQPSARAITTDGGDRSWGDTRYQHQQFGGHQEALAHHYAHEIGHAVDRGPMGSSITNTKGWDRAFTMEIDRHGNPLSRYARTNTKEGFAEFFRAAVHNPEAAQSQFPKAWKELSKRGLVK